MFKFEIHIEPHTILRDREVITKYKGNKILYNVACGNIKIAPFSGNSEILINTEVVDYLSQIKDVIAHFEEGHKESFTVSRDFYSNHLHYTLNTSNDCLKIMDESNKVLVGIVSFEEFKSAFMVFLPIATKKLISLYPELAEEILVEIGCK